jgi:hypothetical protein
LNSVHAVSRRHCVSGLAALLALLALSSCARSTQCTVENGSSVPLAHVVVTGTGFSAPVPDLAPGAKAVVVLHPPGEAGTLGIVFEAAGREHRHSEPVYFEARGYSALVRIGPEFNVTVQVGLARLARTSSSSAPLPGAS